MVEIDGLEPSSLSTAVSLIPAPLPILAHIPIGYRLTTDSRTFLPAGLYCQESVMPGSDATTLPVVPSVELEPTASCSQSRRTTDCAMTTSQTSSGLSGSEEADPSWRWSRWGTYPSPATGFQCWLLIRCFYPHSLSGETALIGRKISRLFRYGRRCQHTACTSCGFAHPLAQCGSSF